MKLVVVSIIIAAPLGWWAAKRWLQGFAYRVDIGWQVFVLAGGLTAAIALITVSMQSIKAALANPVESIRTE